MWLRPPTHVSGCRKQMPHRIRQPHAAAFLCACCKRVLEMGFLSKLLNLSRGFLELCWNEINNDLTGEFPFCKCVWPLQKSNTAGSSSAPAFAAHVCRTPGINSVHLSNLEKRTQQPHTTTEHMEWQPNGIYFNWLLHKVLEQSRMQAYILYNCFK